MITLLGSSVNTSKLAWSKNKVWYELQAATNFATYDNYFVEVQVNLVGDSYVFKQAQSPTSSGILLFEIDGILESMTQKKLFENQSHLPTFSQNSPSLTAQPFKFTVQFQEFIEGVSSGLLSETVLSLSAGLDADDFSYEKQYKWLFTDYKFLTSTALEKPASPDVPDFLYFYNVRLDVPTIDVHVLLHYTDGTTSDFVAYRTFATNEKVSCIPTGVAALAIFANQLGGKTVVSYSVWVSKAADATFRISEVLTYTLIDQPELEKRQFLFGNSLGGYETFFCTGAIQEELTSKKTVLKRVYGKNFRLLDGENFMGEQAGKRKLTAATGWLGAGFADALQDAAISKEIWEITDKGFLPLTIESIQAVYSEKNNELLGYVFSGTYAYDVDLYTKDLNRATFGLPTPPPPPPPPPNAKGLSFKTTNFGRVIFYNKPYYASWTLVFIVKKVNTVSQVSPNFGFSTLMTDGSLSNFLAMTEDGISLCWVQSLASKPMVNGTDIFIVFRYDGTFLTGIVDEVSGAPFQTVNPLSYGTQTIGTYMYGNPGFQLTQIIRDLKIFNRALAQTELDSLYTNRASYGGVLPSAVPNFVSHYKFDDKQGTVLKDYISGFDGFLTNYFGYETSFGADNCWKYEDDTPVTS